MLQTLKHLMTPREGVGEARPWHSPFSPPEDPDNLYTPRASPGMGPCKAHPSSSHNPSCPPPTPAVEEELVALNQGFETFSQVGAMERGYTLMVFDHFPHRRRGSYLYGP
jgi:hypothetical protein